MGSGIIRPPPRGILRPNSAQWTDLPPGYFLYSDFGYGILGEWRNQRVITPTGTVPFGQSPLGVGVNWAAGGATSRANYATFAIPAQFTMEALVRIGTVQNENILSFVNNDGADSGTFERQIAFRSTGVFHFYVFTVGINIITGTATAAAGDIVHVAATYDGTTYRLFVNGALDASSALGAAFGGYTNPSLTAGYQNVATGGGGSTTNQSTHTLLLAAMADRALDAGEIARNAADPWRWVRRRVSRVGVASASPIVGTLAATTANATLAATGALPIVGTAAPTTAAATLSATGRLPIVGTAAQTTAAATLSSTARLAIAGVASVTTAAATIAATGRLPIVGTLTATTAAATVSSAGTLPIVGTLSATLASATLSATGSGAGTGALAVTLDSATLAAAGALSISGVLAVTTANATLLSYQSAVVGIPAPASRTVTWRAEDRTTVWPDDPRTVSWPAQNRTVTWQG